MVVHQRTRGAVDTLSTTVTTKARPLVRGVVAATTTEYAILLTLLLVIAIGSVHILGSKLFTQRTTLKDHVAATFWERTE